MQTVSREKILAAIRQNKPATTALPAAADFPVQHDNLVTAFSEAIRKAGGEVIEITDTIAIPAKVQEALPGMKRIADFVQGIPAVNEQLLEAPELLEVVVMKGELAVAENGAIWLSERNMAHRVLPFITQHLVLVVQASALVGNMHQAYGIVEQKELGYGVFIAGPSKTADIEQSLVIGAHGAKSLLVLLLP